MEDLQRDTEINKKEDKRRNAIKNIHKGRM